MADEQTTLPPEGHREFPEACAWCGADGAKPYEVEKGRYGKGANGVRVLKKAPVIAPACSGCASRFDAEKKAAEDAKASA